MTDDLLARATHALRETTFASSDGMEDMLARLSPAAPPQRGARAVRQRRFRAGLLAIAATFVGVGAWAGATGRLPVLSRVLFPVEARPSATETAPSRRPEERPIARLVASAPLAAPAQAVDVAPSRAAPSVRREHLPIAPHARAQRPAPSAAPSALAPPRDEPDVEALYREAHRSHFTDRDFGRALGLWDRYLAHVGPRARMVVEARFNRAIALARLGRTTEAITALEPFAGGRYGAYRRDEARALIEALERR